MSTTYSAITCIGVLKQLSDFSLNREVRGCDHDLSKVNSFCSECGKPKYMSTELSFHQLANEKGISEDVFHTIHNGNIVLFGKVVENSFDRSIVSCRTPMISDSDLIDIRRLVADTLGKLGNELVEDDFGLWTLPNAC